MSRRDPIDVIGGLLMGASVALFALGGIYAVVFTTWMLSYRLCQWLFGVV